MPKRRREQTPNALKHGVFSTSAILPGEDLAKFYALLRSLVDEWQPSGALECETITTLAECLWRKKRFDTFKKIEQARAMLDKGHTHIARLVAQEAKEDPNGPSKPIVDDIALHRAI